MNSLTFSMGVNDIAVDLTLRTKLLAIATGIVAASNNRLPTSPVEDPAGFYNDQLSGGDNNLISYFNEAAMMQVSVAEEMARKFWLYRYSMLYSTAVAYTSGFDFFSDYTRATFFFAAEDVKLFNEQKRVIITLVNYLRENLPSAQ